MNFPLEIYISHAGGLGDNVNLTGFAAAVRRKFPNSIIRAIVTRQGIVFKDNPAINETIVANQLVFQKTVNGLLHKADIYFDYRYAVKVYFSPRALLIKEVAEYKKEYETAHRKYAYLHEKFLEDIPAFDKLREHFFITALKSSGLSGSDNEQIITLRETDYKAVEKYKGQRYLTINNNAEGGLQTKSWSFAYWAEVNKYIRDIGFIPVQIGIEKDETLPLAERFYGTVQESAALIKQSYGCITIEGGIAHIAKAVGTDSVVIFGPTPVKTFGYSNNINLRSSTCSPCWWRKPDWFHHCTELGENVDKNKVPPCMRDLKPEVVIKAIQKLLERRGLKVSPFLEPNANMDKTALEVSMFQMEKDIREKSYGTPFEEIENDALKNKLGDYQSPESKLAVASLASSIGFKKKILDLSGDDGYTGKYLRQQNNDVIVAGFSKIRLLRASMFNKLKTTHLNSEVIPTGSGIFDYVILSIKVPSNISFGSLLKECERVCKKGGEIILFPVAVKSGLSLKNMRNEHKKPTVKKSPLSLLNFGKKISFGEGIVNKINHITVGVPEGIGDIIWVYRKVKPYCDTMTIVINHTNKQTTGLLQQIHERSVQTIKSFPGVVDVQHRYSFRNWVKEKPHLKDIFNTISATATKANFDFITNSYLEEGVYLEDIDKDLKVEWNMNLPIEPNPLVEKIAGNYLLMYVCEYTSRPDKDKDLKLWSTKEWALLADKILKKKKSNMPIILLGAEFDRKVAEEVRAHLSQLGRSHVWLCIGQPPEKLFYTIKNCQYFIGYQSGLSILADELDIKHMIVYFPTLRQMKDSWAKPQNRTNGNFNYAFFDEDLSEVLKRIKF